MSSGIGYEDSAGRDTAGLGNAWGSRGGSLLRRIFNAVIPVTVVERWYGELDGSLSGLTAGTAGALGFRPAVEFFSPTRDWELHSVQVAYPVMEDVGGTGGPEWYRIVCHMFTAFAGYDPIQFNPTILFGPQLITNTTFNQGTVRGQGGVNPANYPLGIGWPISEASHRVGMFGTNQIDITGDALSQVWQGVTDFFPIGYDKKLVNCVHFRRPLRIKRNRRLSFQLIGETDTFAYFPLHKLVVAILYNELENRAGAT